MYFSILDQPIISNYILKVVNKTSIVSIMDVSHRNKQELNQAYVRMTVSQPIIDRPELSR